MKWASTILSVSIITAFVAFYVLHYRQAADRTRERDLRLLAAAGEALHQATGGDAENVWVRLGEAKCPRGLAIEVYPTRTSGEDAAKTEGERATPSRFCLSFKQILEFVPRAAQVFEKTLLLTHEDEILTQSMQVGAPSIASMRVLRQMSIDGKQPTEKPVKVAEAGPVTRVHLGDGEPFHLFCQPSPPLKLHSATGDGAGASPKPIYLCGLVSDRTMQSSSLWVSPLLVIFLGLLLTFALLIPPFVKVKLLSFTERLGFGDVFGLGLCTALALMLVTLGSQSFASYLRLVAFADGSLSRIADVAASNFERELTAAYAQLDQFSKNLPHGEQPVLRQLNDADRTEYPAVESLAWANSSGKQEVKLSTLALEDQQLLNVAGRDYFQRALQDSSNWVQIDSVRAWSVGSTRAVLAKRADRPGRTPAEGVSILSTELRSFTRPALPDGIRFCVVNRTGDVLFHSDRALSRTHNLLVESDDDSDLRALVETGGRGGVGTIAYFGKAHRAYVRPLGGTGQKGDLSLVVLEDAERLRAVIAQGTLPAIRYCLWYVGIWLGLTLLYVLLCSRRIPWFWPNRNWKATYIALSVVFVALGASALLLAQTLKDQHVVFLLPLALAGTSFVVLQVSRRVRLSDAIWARVGTHASVQRSTYWRCYRIAAILFWVVCAVVPTYAFGRVAIDRAASEFGRSRALSYVAASTERAASPGAAADVGRGYAAIGAYRAALRVAETGSADKLSADLLSELRLRQGDGTRRAAASLVLVGFVALVLLGILVAVAWAERHLLLGGVEAPHRPSWKGLGACKARFLWCVIALPPRPPLDDPESTVVLLFDRSKLRLGQTLMLLEASLAEGKPIVVMTDRSPEDLVAELAADSELEPRTAARFHALTTAFRVIHLAPDPTPGDDIDYFVSSLSKERLPDRDWLEHEVRSNRHVFEACRLNLPPGSFDGIERAERERRLGDAAWAVYHDLWSRCSKIEKLTLTQLAVEGFVNDKRREVVRSLLARGLLARRPMLAPFNDGFASFVERAGTELGVKQWEAPRDGFSWADLRAPLVTLFACSAGVLFYTDRGLVDSTIVWATTLTGVLPNLGRLAAAAGLGATGLATASRAGAASSGVG
jgi:hypothetical protein